MNSAARRIIIKINKNMEKSEEPCDSEGSHPLQ
jgi:hypothetical protein